MGTAKYHSVEEMLRSMGLDRLADEIASHVRCRKEWARQQVEIQRLTKEHAEMRALLERMHAVIGKHDKRAHPYGPDLSDWEFDIDDLLARLRGGEDER